MNQEIFILRNYNRFLVGTKEYPQWDDFFIHRFDTDFHKLIKFNTSDEAQDFIDKNPKLESEFDAWICSTKLTDWT